MGIRVKERGKSQEGMGKRVTEIGRWQVTGGNGVITLAERGRRPVTGGNWGNNAQRVGDDKSQKDRK